MKMLIKHPLRPRQLALLAACGAYALIVIAVIMEHVLLLDACPLCLLQRWVYGALGSIFLLRAWNARSGLVPLILDILASAAALVGILLAGRQVWLQQLPPHLVPSCSAGLDKLLQQYPLLEVLKRVIQGTGECSEIDFELFGLSLAGWSVVAFAVFGMWIVGLRILEKKGG